MNWIYRMRKSFVFVILVSLLLPVSAFCQSAVPVMTLANGTQVSMTQAQVASLGAQPGVTTVATEAAAKAALAAGQSQMYIALPAQLGGGFLVGEPAALAAGMNAAGITTGATAASLTGATALAGSGVAVGASLAAAGGLGVGTIVVGAAIAGVIAGVATQSGHDTPAAHHHSSAHHH
jgi:hypothetical protein